eukprot:4779609-Pleurochrysis_carterae.AAC.1
MAVPDSPRAAKPSADAARKGVVPAGLTPASDREEVASTSTTYTFLISNVLYILKIQKYSWGCDLVVGIGTRQLFSLYYMGLLVREVVGIETRHSWFVPGIGVATGWLHLYDTVNPYINIPPEQ